MSTITEYPVPAAGGPVINQLIAEPKQYRVVRYEYEDGAGEVNVPVCGLQRWVLRYQGLSVAETQVLIDHFNLAKGQVNDFTFANPQDSTSYTGVTYEKIEIPAHTKYWAGNVNVTLRLFT